jgi:hypothetical protein
VITIGGRVARLFLGGVFQYESARLYAQQHAASGAFLAQPFPTDAPDEAFVGLVRQTAHLLGAGLLGPSD